MLTMLKNWKGSLEINGVHYENVSQAILSAKLSDSQEVNIILHSNQKRAKNTLKMSDSDEYRITVRQYMTQKASADFDFMKKWNNDVPMPFRTMIGIVEKETRGMVYMKLHADIYADVITTCMKCGRPLTNKVSQYFGIGPECGGHNYVHPFETDEELDKAVAEYRKQLQKVTWEGWIIRSAILEKEKI